MDLSNTTHSTFEKNDSFTRSENEALRTSVSMEDMSHAIPTESVQTLPRGLVQDMVGVYSSKSATKTKPHPLDILSPDVQPQSGTNAFKSTAASLYTSRTTIGKTDNGIRIIIDLMLEHGAVSCRDISSSSVVTHIPESRILNEFMELRCEGKKHGRA